MGELNKEELQAALTGTFVKRLEVLETVDSTNEEAKRLARTGAPHGTVVIGKTQTAGKGRLGRRFYSPPQAGLYTTILLRPSCTPEQALLITPGAAVACARAIQRACGLEVKIKWVNDLYFQGKKLCGILSESALGVGGSLEYLVVGMGINVQNSSFPPELKEIATSLEACGIPEVDLNQLAAYLLEEFQQIYQQLESGSFLEEYKRRSCVIGKEVEFSAPNGTHKRVKVLDIDQNANLVVQDEKGICSKIGCGEVSLRGDWT